MFKGKRRVDLVSLYLRFTVNKFTLTVKEVFSRGVAQVPKQCGHSEKILIHANCIATKKSFNSVSIILKSVTGYELIYSMPTS